MTAQQVKLFHNIDTLLVVFVVVVRDLQDPRFEQVVVRFYVLALLFIRRDVTVSLTRCVAGDDRRCVSAACQGHQQEEAGD